MAHATRIAAKRRYVPKNASVSASSCNRDTARPRTEPQRMRRDQMREAASAALTERSRLLAAAAWPGRVSHAIHTRLSLTARPCIPFSARLHSFFLYDPALKLDSRRARGKDRQGTCARADRRSAAVRQAARNHSAPRFCRPYIWLSRSEAGLISARGSIAINANVRSGVIVAAELLALAAVDPMLTHISWSYF